MSNLSAVPSLLLLILPDAAIVGVTVLLLLASWGVIVVCDRLMEDSQ
jgi:hypothetical protein